MKILFTGGSSFTGYWFIKELAAAGHEVVAVFRRQPDQYPDDLRKRRVGALIGLCRPVFGMGLGDDRFLALTKDNDWDLFCHHGADVTDYKNPNFDVMAAVENNTHRLSPVLDSLMRRGCSKVILTGSVFENDEGTGSKDLRAFSPYALSKAFTWQLFRYHTQVRQMALGKFVIPNPFGPYEEARFTYYLMKCWFSGTIAIVNAPSYVRDNIHVSLLAGVYAHFAKTLGNGITRINPSGYVESQAAFTERVAGEMRQRLGLLCKYERKTQTEFAEPRIRINTDWIDPAVLNWDETRAWDGIADYYKQLMSK
jgi:nucleoside-diphosphate-sugar epimerase